MTIRTLALVTTFTVATSTATRLGATTVAAHQVASQVWLFLALVVDAIAIAAQAIVGTAVGESDRAGGDAAAHRMLQWSAVWGFVLAVVFWLLRDLLPRWFTSEEAVVALAASLMPFVALMQPLNALVFVWDGIFIGAGRFRFLALSMVGAAVVTVGVLLRAGSITDVWWAIVMLMVLRAVPMAVAHRRGIVRVSD